MKIFYVVIYWQCNVEFQVNCLSPEVGRRKDTLKLHLEDVNYSGTSYSFIA